MARILLVVAALLFGQGTIARTLGVPANWGYQLDRISPAAIADSPYELMVIDYSRDGGEVGAFTPAEVATMRRMPDGGQRTVLAYFSIGEAEDYRFYWRPSWQHQPPAWLDEENADWPGNYKVHYWDTDWQRILFGHPGAYLDQIIDAGFDGVYLDLIDAFEYYQEQFPRAPGQMADLVAKLADYARTRKPGFLVFAQNGETLIDDPRFLGAIDGIAKEDLYYGMEVDGRANSADEIRFSLQYLTRTRDAGKTVLLVTYAQNRADIARVREAGERYGFIVYVGVRDLDRLLPPQGADVNAYPMREAQTPGNFYAQTTPRGTFKNQLFLIHSRERSSYEERGESGELVYGEHTKFRQWDLGAQIKYGLTDYLDLGFRLPLSRASESTQVTEEESDRLKNSSCGLGNPTLLAGLGQSWNQGNSNALVELELGLPLNGKDEVFYSGADFRLAVNLEHYWDRIGLIGVIARNWYAEEDFHDWSDYSEYQLGLGAELSPRLFAALLGGESEHIVNAEFSLEYLLDARRSVELNLISDLEGDRDAWGAMLAVNFWLD